MRREIPTDTGRDEAILAAAGAGLLSIGAGVAWTALHLAAAWEHTTAPPDDPKALVQALADRRVVWDTTATVIAIGLGVALTVLVALAMVLCGRVRPKRLACDRAVRHMARGADLRALTAPARRAKHTGMGVATQTPGIPLGRVLLPPGGRARRAVYASWEDMTVLIAGPRTNKTTAYAIPILLAAPGPALLTSNKRDALDATRAMRGNVGDVWVFDPQGVAAEPPAWWWDPISYLTDPGSARPAPARAGRLAAQLVTSTTHANAATDAYFDTEKQNLIALLLLAAACGAQGLPAVWSWLTDHTDTTPTRHLAQAGFGPHAQALQALAGLPDKQREGVYGGARAVMGFLLDPDITRWITPTPDGSAKARKRFDPATFATSTDTVYLLSRDHAGGAAPLVAVLTMAVTDALETRATASPGGRLAIPFTGVLDEAANICRLRDLDGMYSHYGSRGICLVTVLQNWAQGEQAWGPLGMEKLWSAANMAIYGGGVDDARFLDRLSKLIGTHERLARTHTTGERGRRSTARAVAERTILTPAELRELPPGRAVLFASGTPAALLEPLPWWRGPHADDIRTALGTAQGRVPAQREPDTTPDARKALR